MSESRKDAIEDLRLTDRFFQTRGMTLSILFAMKTLAKFWAIVDPELTFGEHRIQAVGPEQELTYLGVTFTPYGGICGNRASREFVSSCGRVEHLNLKLQQKLKLIAQYLYPRYRYALSVDMPSVQALKGADDEIRQIYKRILHLPSSITDHLFYTRIKDGGLGLPRWETEIQFSILHGAAKMERSEDVMMRELARETIKAKQAVVAAR